MNLNQKLLKNSNNTINTVSTENNLKYALVATCWASQNIKLLLDRQGNIIPQTFRALALFSLV